MISSLIITKPSNKDIARVLNRIAELLEAQDANPFRVNAYRKAARHIRRMEEPVAELEEHGGVEALQELPTVYVHDVGMALLPLEVINNVSPLTETDLQQIREHPKIGFELLRYMKQWREAAYIVLQHHERMDGRLSLWPERKRNL